MPGLTKTLPLDGLNPFSRQVAEAVFADHPDWVAYARAEVAEVKPGVLFIEIPAPETGKVSLMLYTDSDEITISYDVWHMHCSKWGKLTDDVSEFAADSASAIVEVLLSERWAVAVRMIGDRWAGSSILTPDELPDPPELPGGRVYVRSWRGTRDSD